MKFEFLADASDTPPKRPSNPSVGYPSNGDPVTGKPPTTPGAWFYYMLMVEFTTLIEQNGLEPSAENLHQLADVFADFKARASAAEGFATQAKASADAAAESASGVVTETASKIKEIQDEGSKQVSAVTAVGGSVSGDVEAGIASLQKKLEELVAQLDAEGGTEAAYVKQQAQDILDQITASEANAKTSADSAAASAASASSLKTDMEADISAAKSAMATAQADGVKAVQAAQTAGVSAVQSAQAEALSAITLEKTSGVAAVKEAGEAAQTAANSAAESASSAGASADAAKSSANSAASSASAASLSQSSAKVSADSAASSASAAKSSQTAASASQTAAKNSETAAKTSETNAAASASAAAETKTGIDNEIAQAKTDIATAKDNSISAVKSQEAASIQAIEADSVLAGYAKKDELSSLIAAAVAEAKLAAHPVGSIYCSVDSANPSSLFGGTWEQVSSGRVLQGADSSHSAGTTAEAGLPNITGAVLSADPTFLWGAGTTASGAFKDAANSTNSHIGSNNWNGSRPTGFTFNASWSSAIYGASSTVQPPAFFVYIWKRTA